jgi:hypothetical protein
MEDRTQKEDNPSQPWALWNANLSPNEAGLARTDRRKPQAAALTKPSMVMPNMIVKLLLLMSPSQINSPMLNKATHLAKFQMQCPNAMHRRSWTVILLRKDMAGSKCGHSFLLMAGEWCKMVWDWVRWRFDSDLLGKMILMTIEQNRYITMSTSQPIFQKGYHSGK